MAEIDRKYDVRDRYCCRKNGTGMSSVNRSWRVVNHVLLPSISITTAKELTQRSCCLWLGAFSCDTYQWLVGIGRLRIPHILKRDDSEKTFCSCHVRCA